MKVIRDGIDGAKKHGIASAFGILVIISCFASAFSSCGSYLAQRKADDAVDAVQHEAAARLHDACLDLNRNRHDTRDLVSRGDLTVGESVIEAATSNTTTPQVTEGVERFREILRKNERKLLDEHALDDLDCDELAPLDP